MIDMHNHFMYGIDDGCKTKEDSIKVIEKLKQLGFDKIVATPHYIKDTEYNKNNKEKKVILEEIKEDIKDFDVKLFLANEVYSSCDIHDLVLNHEISTINKSRYILIEFPMNITFNILKDNLYDLKIKGYIPVLAHPERYDCFVKNLKLLNELYNDEILFQSNYGSIIDEYGKQANKIFTYLLKNNMISFLSTDTHHCNSSLIENFEKAKNKIIKIIGKDNFDKLSNYNIQKVLDDTDL